MDTEAQAEKATKTCGQCASSIPAVARRCSVCQSPQDWRAYLSIGNSTLALIIAAASVIALTSKQLSELFLPTSSDIDLYLENTTGEGISFIARNKGKMGAVVTLNSFVIGVDKTSDGEIIISIPPRGHYVAPTSEQRVAFSSYPKMPHYICNHLRSKRFFADFGDFDWAQFDVEDRSVITFDTFFSMNDKLQCSVNLDVVDADSTKNAGPLGIGVHVRNLTLDCSQIRWVSDCLSMAMAVQKVE